MCESGKISSNAIGLSQLLSKSLQLVEKNSKISQSKLLDIEKSVFFYHYLWADSRTAPVIKIQFQVSFPKICSFNLDGWWWPPKVQFSLNDYIISNLIAVSPLDLCFSPSPSLYYYQIDWKNGQWYSIYSHKVTIGSLRW